MKLSRFASGVGVAVFGESQNIDKRRRGSKILEAEVVLAELSSELSGFSFDDDDTASIEAENLERKTEKKSKTKTSSSRWASRKKKSISSQKSQRSKRSMRQIENLWEDVSSELSIRMEVGGFQD